ncbi:MAG: hypothetical protein IJA72_00715, partial [Clostridia bacterium]|nr:hypothetical protein [Clostridia bacterium]
FTGLLLVLIFFIYFIKTFFEIKNSLIKKGKIDIGNPIAKIKLGKTDKIINILKFIVGTLFIFVGAQFIINTTETLSIKLKISQTLIALIVIAVATSLPELIATITSVKRKRLNLAIGNIIGANIINLTLLFGLAGILSGTEGIALSTSEIATILPTILLASIILAFPILFKRRTYKWQGVTLLSLYAIYCVIVILCV